MEIKNQDILAIFKKTGALLNGHFKLSSGLHSGQYLQCAQVLQYPEYAAQMGEAIAGKFKDEGITCVAGPALGGIIIAHEVAKALGKRCVFGEREDGKMTLRRGFKIGPDDKVLAIEDVITTGKSINELISVIRDTGAVVIGAGAIVDRSSERIDFGCELKTLIKLDVQKFKPEECNLCKDNTPLVKPGSRK
ncbi:MAG: orotate phosphoribosyltransferase [Candidatus Omnitrophica bacterium]|nr:orotate phosphoribosyltransferase [Candidatus Omnitrophota bacterium]